MIVLRGKENGISFLERISMVMDDKEALSIITVKMMEQILPKGQIEIVILIQIDRPGPEILV